MVQTLECGPTVGSPRSSSAPPSLKIGRVVPPPQIHKSFQTDIKQRKILQNSEVQKWAGFPQTGPPKFKIFNYLKQILLKIGFIEEMITTGGNKEVSQTFSTILLIRKNAF